MEKFINERRSKSNSTFVNALVTLINDVTPHVRRITFKNEQVKKLENCIPGAHLKVFIPQKGQIEAVFPEIVDGRPYWADESTKPVVRTYTLRSIDLTTGELAIDFVLHGDNGPASAWAGNVAVGDYLGIGIRPGKILPKADWYLFSGDETATPAISAMLEALPEEADGIALLEVGSAADIMEISTKSKVVIRWFSRNDEPAEESDLLLNVIKDLPSLSAGFQSRYIWAAGESAAIKTIRVYANENLEIAPGELSAKAYWTAGISEDDFRRHKNKE